MPTPNAPHYPRIKQMLPAFVLLLFSGAAGLTAQTADLSGTYRIRVKADNRYLHEDGNGDKLLSTRYQVNDEFTHFRLSRNSDNSYKITTLATNRYWHEHGCCDNIISTRYNFDDEWNKFNFERQNDGSFLIRGKASGKFLHEDGGGDKLLSTRYQPSPPDDFSRFFLESIQGAEADLSGTYRIRVKADGLYLHDDGGGDQLLSTRYQVTDDFTRFRVSRNADGTYRITTVATNRYWHEHAGGDMLISTRYNFDDEWNKFLFEKEIDGSYIIRGKASGKILHEDGGGDKLLSTRYQPTPPDDFNRFLLESEAKVGPGGNSTALRMAHSGMCLAASSLAPGAPIVQQECSAGDASQGWTERFVDGPWALYVNNESGLCMEPGGNINQRGIIMLQRGCDPNRKEQWFHLRPVEAESDQNTLVPRLSTTSKCSDIEGVQTVPGARLLLWDCTGGGNQRMTRFANTGKKAEAAFNATNFINQNVLGIEDPDPEICWKKTTTRTGEAALSCPASHPDRDGAFLCYQQCAAGYSATTITTCGQVCPAGWGNEPATCRKPGSYTTTGYALKLYNFWWSLSDLHAEAKARCESGERQSCEWRGAMYYPKCKATFGPEPLAPYVCAAVCQNGMTDSGFGSCWKKSYFRGAVPTQCAAGTQRDAHDPLGLCYKSCPGNSTAVGPVCWAGCGGEYGTACGAACARSIDACVFAIGDMVTQTGFMVLNVANLVLTGGGGTPAIKAAQAAAKKAGKLALKASEKAAHKAAAKAMLEKGVDHARKNQIKKVLDRIGEANDAASWIEKMADSLVNSLEQGEFDYRELAPTLADFDPTGVLSVINAFNKPICK